MEIAATHLSGNLGPNGLSTGGFELDWDDLPRNLTWSFTWVPLSTFSLESSRTVESSSPLVLSCRLGPGMSPLLIGVVFGSWYYRISSLMTKLPPERRWPTHLWQEKYEVV